MVGYFGYGNRGDEWILSKSIDLLENHFPKATIYVGYKKAQKNKRKNLVYIHRFSPFQLIQTLVKSQMVVYGGGGILQDRTSTRSLWYYTSLIRLARVMNKPVIMIGQGVGPLTNERAKRWVEKALVGVQGVAVRDSVSYSTIKALDEKIEVLEASDMTYYHADHRMVSRRDMDRHAIGLSLRQHSFSKKAEKQLKRFLAETPKKIMVMNMQERTDEEDRRAHV